MADLPGFEATTGETGGPLTPASCLGCRSQIWAWPGGLSADGRQLGFDLVGEGGQRMLFLHDCEADEYDGFDVEEPDFGEG